MATATATETATQHKILIVDDVPSNVVVLGAALSNHYHVRFATSGAEALELARREPPDLMLLDVMMPGMSGHDLHQLLRQDPGLHDVAVIFVTADTTLGSQLEGFRLGAEDYITKPIVLPILLARIKNVLERTARRQELELSLLGAEQGLWEWQLRDESVQFNANWAIPLGYARGEMDPCVMTWRHLVHPDDWPILFAARDAYLHGQTLLFDPEIRIRHKNDLYVWMQLHGKAVERDDNGCPARLMGTYMNVERRKHAELELRRREAQLTTMIASLQDAVLVLDDLGMIAMCHVPADNELGFVQPSLVGKPYAAALPSEVVRQVAAGVAEARAYQRVAQVEFEFTGPDGRQFVHLTLNALAGSDDKPTGYLVVLRDVSARKAAEEEIRSLAFFDALTRLPNLRLLRERLRHTLAATVVSQRHAALLFLDLDNFKRFEHTQGRSVGDQFLVEIARRIAACVGENDTVARQGGDKFLVLLEQAGEDAATAQQAVQRLGRHILSAIDDPLAFTDQGVRVTCSMGATLFSGQGCGEDALLQQAELAMYSAKSAGGNDLRFFDPQMQTSVLTQVALEQAMIRGLPRGEFFLVYQPQVDASGSIVGAEALVRWQHPEQGMLGPMHFIPLAEDTALIVPLGRRILQMACGQLYRWQFNPLTAHVSLAVNVSSRQFDHPEFVDELLDLIHNTGINARQLKIEITESLFLENTEAVMQKMTRLRDAGVCFSIDDFGTGYSSLSYLKKLPLDQLKIDQSFVQHALDSPVDAAIVRAIMTLGNNLEIAVIAEGVETAEQWHLLRDEGCASFQGYLFSRPVSVEAFEALLAKGPLP